MNNFKKNILWVALLLFVYSPGISINNDSIGLQIEQYIITQWTKLSTDVSDAQLIEIQNSLIINIKPVWEQSNVKKCEEFLEIESVKKQFIGNLSLKVQCKSKGWGMYVPVYVGKLEKVIALNNNVERGQKMSASLFEFQTYDVGKLSQGYYTEASQIKNMEAARYLVAGQLLNPLMLKEMDLVKKGDHVMIVIQKGELRVQMPGIALASGKKGKQISVKNRSSSRIVKAVIKERGLVEIII